MILSQLQPFRHLGTTQYGREFFGFFLFLSLCLCLWHVDKLKFKTIFEFFINCLKNPTYFNISVDCLAGLIMRAFNIFKLPLHINNYITIYCYCISEITIEWWNHSFQSRIVFKETEQFSTDRIDRWISAFVQKENCRNYARNIMGVYHLFFFIVLQHLLLTTF